MMNQVFLWWSGEHLLKEIYTESAAGVQMQW